MKNTDLFLPYYIFLMINMHCTLILILDYIEKQFSAISDIGVKENFALTL